MKCISIRQPWAWLILHGQKDVENRSWNTKYRGPLLIHASASRNNITIERLKEIERQHQVRLPNSTLGGSYQLGGIVGICKLVEVIDPVMGGGGKWHERGFYGFVLADVEPLKFKPLCGQMGIFEVDVDPEYVRV